MARIGLLVLLLVSGLALAGEDKDKGFKEEVKEGAKETWHGFKEGVKDAGRSLKQGGKAIKEDAKESVDKAKKDLKD